MWVSGNFPGTRCRTARSEPRQAWWWVSTRPALATTMGPSTDSGGCRDLCREAVEHLLESEFEQGAEIEVGLRGQPVEGGKRSGAQDAGESSTGCTPAARPTSTKPSSSRPATACTSATTTSPPGAPEGRRLSQETLTESGSPVQDRLPQLPGVRIHFEGSCWVIKF
jgi:hypothetical protein